MNRTSHTLSRLVVPLFLEILFICYFTVFSLSISIKIFDSLDSLVKESVELQQAINFFFYTSILVTIDLYPLVFPLSIIIFFLYLSKTNELTALRTIGIDYYSLFRIFLSISTLITIVAYLIDFFVAPLSKEKVDFLFNNLSKKRPTISAAHGENILIHGDNIIIIEKGVREISSFMGVVIINPRKDEIRISMARSIKYLTDDIWIASNHEMILVTIDEGFRLSKDETKKLLLKDLHKTILYVGVNPSHLSVTSLVRGYFLLQKNNQREYYLETMLFKKLFTPLVVQTIIVVIFPIVFNLSVKDPLKEVVYGLLIIGVIHTLWKFSLNLSNSGNLSLPVSFLIIEVALIFFSYYLHRRLRLFGQKC